MSKRLVLEELFKLEVRTLRLLGELDLSTLDRQTEVLIHFAQTEHSRRIQELKAELVKFQESVPVVEHEERNAEAGHDFAGSEALVAAELSEERLVKRYHMAESVVKTTFLKELALEQHALWLKFNELKKSSTLKMKAFREPISVELK